MRPELGMKGRRQGKTFASLWYVHYAMKTGINLAIASNNTSELYNAIMLTFPDVNMKIEGICVVINPRERG